jgi:FolB domain-containing protein
MAHFSHILTVNRLHVRPHLGFYESERAVRQDVELSFRIYFEEAPACCGDDHAEFLDYGSLCDAVTAWAEAGNFRLVEFMGMETFRFVRRYIDEKGHPELKLWVQLKKMKPPIANLLGGADFIHTDLPPGSTTAFTATL